MCDENTYSVTGGYEAGKSNNGSNVEISIQIYVHTSPSLLTSINQTANFIGVHFLNVATAKKRILESVTIDIENKQETNEHFLN